MQKLILKIDGIFLLVMGTLAAFADLVGYFTGRGPSGKAYFQNSIAIGGFEAHGLAVIMGLILVLQRKSADPGFLISAP